MTRPANGGCWTDCPIPGRVSKPPLLRCATIAGLYAPADASSAVNFDQLQAFAADNAMLSLALAGLTIALIVTEVMRLFRGYTGLRPAQLTALVNTENALVLDLSASGEFEKGHIPGSRNLPGKFDPRHKLLAGAKERPVVLVCRSGQTAPAAAAQLKKAGFTRVYVLEGGVAAWQAADLPLAKGRA